MDDGVQHVDDSCAVLAVSPFFDPRNVIVSAITWEIISRHHPPAPDSHHHRVSLPQLVPGR